MLSFFNSLPQIALLLTKSGEIRHINEKAEEWLSQLGLSATEREEIKYYVDLLKSVGVDVSKTQVIANKLNNLLKGSGEEFEEEILLAAEEKNFWLRIRAHRHEEYIIVSQEDITKRKSMEKELNLTQFSVDNAAIGVFRINPEGEFEYVNDHACEMLNYSREELIGMRVSDVDPNHNPEQREDHWKEMMRKKVERIKTQLQTKEGEIIPAQIASKYLKYKDKEYEFAFVQDITAEKMEELKAKALFENSTSAIAMLNSEGEIIDINEEFQEVFGYALSEIEGEHLDDMLERGKEGSSDRQKTEKLLQGKRLKGEGTRYDKYGNPKEFIFHGIPILIDDEVLGFYAMYDDISELVSAREKITELHQIALELSRSEKEEEIYRETVDAAERILEFDFCVLDIVEDNKLEVKAISSGVNPDSVKTLDISEDESITIDVYKSQEPFFTRRLSEEQGVNPLNNKYESVLTVPIGEYGVFQAVAEKEDIFDRLDLQMAELLVSHTRTAIRELEAKQEMQYISFHDGLTDLYNRSYMEEEMQRLDTERQHPISLIMCDVNGMKIVNDTYGHKKGDEMLNKVAENLRETTRDEDIVSRWAGDEFVILLPQTKAEVAERIAGRIEDACEDAELGDIPITLGIGIAAKESIAEDFEDVLIRADEKMYRDKLMKTASAENRMLDNMLNTLADKSAESKKHVIKMTELVHKLGERIDLPNEQLDRLSLLASLHDIGKTKISEDILTKPGELTDEEWQIIKEHPEKGHTILTATDNFAHIAKEVLYHHEHWDGTGYPEGLKGKEIPLLSRVIAIADAYDVMTAGRPYQEVMSKEEALQEIEDCAGSQFDPELAEIFVEIMGG